MKSKGISPLIAAVLLIAFTMAVASIFAQWAPQLIEDAQGNTQEQASEIQDCSDITFDVISGTTDNATIQQKTGTNAVGNLSITWFYSDGTEPVQANNHSIDNNRGSTTAYANSHGTAGSSLDRIEVDATNCEGAATTTYEP